MMSYLERRATRLLAQADRIQDVEASGDIYGAPIEVYRRWSTLTRIASELLLANRRAVSEDSTNMTAVQYRMAERAFYAWHSAMGKVPDVVFSSLPEEEVNRWLRVAVETTKEVTLIVIERFK